MPPSSFVYPVRSLLTGKIHPAADQTQDARDLSTLTSRPVSSSDLGAGVFAKLAQSCDVLPLPSFHEEGSATRERASSRASDDPRTAGPAADGIPASQGSSAVVSPAQATEPDRSSCVSSGLKDTTSSSGASSSKQKNRRSRPNFRHFPADDSSAPRTFSMTQSGFRLPGEDTNFTSLNAQTLEPESIENHPLPLVAGPALAATSTSLLPTPPVPSPSWGQLASSSYFPTASDSFTSPPTEVSVGATVVETAGLEQFELERQDTVKPEKGIPEEVTSGHLNGDEEESDESRPFNLSEYGLVHLPPLPPSNPNSETCEGNSSKGSERYYSAGSAYTASRSGSQSLSGTSRSEHGSGLRIRRRRAQVGTNGEEAFQSSSESKSNDQSRSHSAGSGSMNSLSSEEPLMTVCFQHKEDENGNHVITGREGQLQRCEDEVSSESSLAKF